MMWDIETSKWANQPRASTLIIGLILLGWGIILLSVFDMLLRGVAGNAGLGMGVFSDISPIALSDVLGQPYKFSICVNGDGQWAAVDFIKSFFMWGAMILAMMVPTLLSGNRHRPKNLYFISGYVLAWSLGSLLAVLLQWLLNINGVLDQYMVSGSALFNAIILIGVGAFQLSPFKQDQLAACRHSGRAVTGWQAGINCIRCCGPLMMVMFVFGLMNIVLMAVLTLFMLMERAIKPVDMIVKLSGAALIFLGLLNLI